MDQSNPSINSDTPEDYGFLERFKTLGILIVVLMYVLVIVFYFLKINTNFNPPNLIFILNLIFVFIPTLVIAFIAARSFLSTGNWSVLWVGVGTLSFGLAAVLSFLISMFAPINAASTAFPIIMIFAGFSYFLAALFLLSRTPSYDQGRGRLIILLLANIGTLIFILIFTIISIQSILPTFFIQGGGSSALRLIILATSAFLFLISGLIIYQQYLKTKSILLYWLTLGLLLILLVLIGNLLNIAVGTPLNWTLRVTQLLAGVYLLITSLVILKEAKFQEISFSEVLSKLFQTQETNLLLLDDIKDAIIIVDTNFIVSGWNKGAEETYKWNAEEVIGRKTEFLNTNYPGFNKNDIINHAITEGKWTGDAVQKTKDGNEISVLSSISPIKNDSSKIIGFVSVNHDFTDRKKSEEELKKRAALLDISYEAIFSWEYDGTILSWNKGAERLYGYGEEEAIGLKSHSLLKAEFPIEFNEFLEKLTNDKIWTGELNHTTKNGRKIIVETRQQLIQDKTGGKFVIETNRDITDRKESEEKIKTAMDELKRSNQELERFAYVSSHDLQEPLRMVTLYSQLLEKRYKNSLDNDADDFIEYIVENARRMKQLIEDLLEYSRVTSQAKEFKNVDLEKIFEVLLSNLSLSITENNVNVTHEPLPTVFVNPNQMMQVFQNLITNAIKFRGEESPEIKISVLKGKTEWKFSISDNGIGIKPKHQKQIFDVFKRLHTREEYPGTGIGLSIVKKIITHHGGQIWVESKLGEGSTFYFTIPLDNEHTNLF